MKFYTKEFVTRIIYILLGIGLVMLFVLDGHAHHKSNHAETFVGEFTEIRAHVFVCRDEEAARLMLEATLKQGKNGYFGSFQALEQMGVCVQGPAYVRVDEILSQGEKDGVTITLVRLTLRLGDKESPPLYSVLAGVKVLSKEAKCVNCRPA